MLVSQWFFTKEGSLKQEKRKKVNQGYDKNSPPAVTSTALSPKTEVMLPYKPRSYLPAEMKRHGRLFHKLVHCVNKSCCTSDWIFTSKQHTIATTSTYNNHHHPQHFYKDPKKSRLTNTEFNTGTAQDFVRHALPGAQVLLRTVSLLGPGHMLFASEEKPWAKVSSPPECFTALNSSYLLVAWIF